MVWCVQCQEQFSHAAEHLKHLSRKRLEGLAFREHFNAELSRFIHPRRSRRARSR